MRLLKVTMMTVMAVCMLAATGFAYTLPNGMTAYDSMGKVFVWNTWSDLDPEPSAPADGAFLKFDGNQSVTGFKPVSGFGGDLSFMAGNSAMPLSTFQSRVDFSNYTPNPSADEASFGLEFSWMSQAGSPGEDDEYSGIGVYRGTVKASAENGLPADVDGYAVSFWSDSAFYKDNIWFSTTPGEAGGSLSLDLLSSGELAAKFMLADGTWESFALIDMTVLGWNSGADDQILGLSGQGADVDFAGYESSPAAPAATPIPGAVWLLGSGLVGLAGLRKRFQR